MDMGDISYSYSQGAIGRCSLTYVDTICEVVPRVARIYCMFLINWIVRWTHENRNGANVGSSGWQIEW
jgi:hypothetical protein